MTKGYGEAGPTMRSRLNSSRGPQRFLLLAVCLVLGVIGLNYWRLVSTNAELSERLHILQELLKHDNAGRLALDGELQRCKDATLKAAAERHRMEVEQEDRLLKMQQQAEQMANLEEERTDCHRQAERLQQQQVQDLTTTQVELEMVQQNLTRCLSQSCDDRVKQLQFDLDTCQFSQKHVGNPGIIRHTGGDLRGPGQLPLLSPAAVTVQQSALRAAVQPSPRGSLERPMGRGGGSDVRTAAEEEALNPAESPAGGEVLSAGGELRPAAGAADGSHSRLAEVAPVEGDVLTKDDQEDPDDPASQLKVAEYAKEAADKADEVGDGAGDGAGDGGGDGVGDGVGDGAGDGAGDGGGDGAGDGGGDGAGDGGGDGAGDGAGDGDGVGDAVDSDAALKEAALISGLQELSEKAGRLGPAPDAEPGAEPALGDGLPETRPDEPLAAAAEDTAAAAAAAETGEAAAETGEAAAETGEAAAETGEAAAETGEAAAETGGKLADFEDLAAA